MATVADVATAVHVPRPLDMRPSVHVFLCGNKSMQEALNTEVNFYHRHVAAVDFRLHAEEF
jgi:hypothetical protein